MSPWQLTRNWPSCAFRELGGGSAPAQQIESAPVPTPAPPVTPDSQAVVAAELQAQQANAMKKSVQKTILAGDSGMYSQKGMNMAGQPSQPTSFKTKLG